MCCVQLLDLRVAYQNLAISCIQFVMNFIGCLLPSVLYLRFGFGDTIWGISWAIYVSCTAPFWGLTGWRNLSSTVCGELDVPFARISTMRHRTFSVIGPCNWNCLPFNLCFALAWDSVCTFSKCLKTVRLERVELGVSLSSYLQGALCNSMDVLNDFLCVCFSWCKAVSLFSGCSWWPVVHRCPRSNAKDS